MSAMKFKTAREFLSYVFAALAVVVVLAPLFSVPRAFVGLKKGPGSPDPLGPLLPLNR